MNSLRKCFNQILNILAGGSFLAMVVLTCWQVLTRYVLKAGILPVCLDGSLRLLSGGR